MEKASAACAMDWSTELEKGLRSNKPGHHTESIQLIGHRIQKWCQEPKLKLTVYNMFRMVHGEERLYADAILLRLAHAFGAGDRDTKIHIVNLFLSEMRYRDRKKRQEYGIFSKMTADNHLELLRRIKVALDDADVESKALTLVLLGCWSEIAKDFPEIRYAVLSNVVSPHALEVKASLFAAGCFAELSYDFASAFLEMLISIVGSPKTSSTVKTAAAWVFRKMGRFHSLTNKAYKSGSEIVLKSSQDDWLVPMLISLSKLASKSLLLSSGQVSLLCGLPTHKMTPHVQLIIIRCLRYILEKTCHITVGAFSFENLLRILDKQVPSALKCEALRLVLTIVSCVPYDMLFSKIQEFSKLLTLVVSAIRSPHAPDLERVLAIQVLVGISNKLKGRTQIAASELNILPFLSDVVSSIGDRVILQLKQMSEYCEASEIELGLTRLLQLLFLLIEGPPEVSLLVLDKLCFILEHVVNICHENMATTETKSEVHKIFRVEEKDRSFLVSKFIHHIYKCLLVYVERLYVSDATTTELLHKLKQLVSFVCQCNLFSCSTHVKYALLMHSCCNFGCLLTQNGKEGEGSCLKEIILCNSSEDRTLNSECLGNMLAGNDNWAAYLVGKFAACQGAWFVSKSVFGHLETRVQSKIYSCWLRCLSQFAHSEKSLQEMFLQDPASVLMDTATVPLQMDDYHKYILSPDSIKMLISACDGLHSSERLLGATTLLKQTFCFQRWFLALRMKVLAVILDLFKLLATIPFNQEAVSVSQQTEGASDTNSSRLFQERESVMCVLAGISLKLQRIGREYDLMNSSFIDMDQKSFRVVSSIALSCSLLAFCTGFAYLEGVKSCNSKDSGSCLHVTLIEDLVGRLSHIDPETGMSIISTLKGDAVHVASLQSHCRFRSFNIVYEAGNILRVCRAAVKKIRGMQNGTKGTSDECLLPVLSNKAAHFLVDISKEWMSIPFRTPKFFFQVRPCVGAVLFSSSFNSENPSDISVLPGSHLSLNLCLQLKNMPQDLPSRITKVFCILHCKNSLIKPHKKPSETTFSDYQSWTTDSMMHLHKKLWWYVMEQAGEELAGNENDTRSNNGLVAETYVCFETNGGVQGFTTCLLDVSVFPPGSYRIDWQSCCIDDSGSYWSLLPLSPGPVCTIRSSKS